MKPAATIDRNFRTFLLVSQLEAKAIGARLQKARLESGMTQEQVADVATFSKRSLQDYASVSRCPIASLSPAFASGNVSRMVRSLLRVNQRA